MSLHFVRGGAADNRDELLRLDLAAVDVNWRQPVHAVSDTGGVRPCAGGLHERLASPVCAARLHLLPTEPRATGTALHDAVLGVLVEVGVIRARAVWS